MRLLPSGFRFRPGLYPTLAFLLLLPLLISLGMWQLRRADEKQALVDASLARQQDLPLDLNLAKQVDPRERFRPATAHGHFVPGRQWLQDNRLHQGRPGYHVYSLFQLDGDRGHFLLVNRGWAPLGSSRQQLPSLPLPQGEMQLAGQLNRPASVGIDLGEVDYTAPGLSVLPYLSVDALGQAIGHPLGSMALVLDAGQPGSLTADPLPVSRMGPEKHLGYAVQWFGMAVALVMIYVGVNLRRNESEKESLS